MLKYNTTVKEIRNDGLQLIDETGSEYFYPSDLVLFTAGTVQSQLIKQLPLPKDRNGRIIIKQTLQVQGEDNVFALGDCSAIDGEILPATAQVAMQQSGTLAKNLLSVLSNDRNRASNNTKTGYKEKPLEKFHYISLGEMLSLGDTNAAITSLGGLLGVKGPLAALGRRAVYAVRMPTTKQTVKAAITASAVTAGKLIANAFGRKD